MPERRPEPEELERIKAEKEAGAAAGKAGGGLPVWRCKVCGYLAARESAPKVCPICKATQDRFELFLPA